MQTVIPVEDVSGGVSGTSWQQYYDSSTPTANSSLTVRPQQDLTPVLLAVGGGVLLLVLLNSGGRR